MSELTDDERRDLICDCGASACGVDECPHHGGNDELWVDVPARVMADRVEAIIDARVQAERDRLLARIEALHRPWHICDDCDHEHTDADVREGRAFDTGYSYTCIEAATGIACVHCCTDDGEQTEECATYHEHTMDPDTRCPTSALLAEERAR